jgi:hypothetical protein
MIKKRARFADKRLRYRIKNDHLKIQDLEAQNSLLAAEIVELRTSAFNYIFHMDEQSITG